MAQNAYYINAYISGLTAKTSKKMFTIKMCLAMVVSINFMANSGNIESRKGKST